MPSAADDCWRLSADCSHWAQESRDKSARLAFRQMATAWAGLAFSQDFISPTHELADLAGSESTQAAPAENTASPHTEDEEIVPIGNPDVDPETPEQTPGASTNNASGQPESLSMQSPPIRSYCRPLNWLTQPVSKIPKLLKLRTQLHQIWKMKKLTLRTQRSTRGAKSRPAQTIRRSDVNGYLCHHPSRSPSGKFAALSLGHPFPNARRRRIRAARFWFRMEAAKRT
jgi:hypothetical protein